MKVFLEIQNQKLFLYALKTGGEDAYTLENLYEGSLDTLKDDETIKEVRKKLDAGRVRRCEAILDKKYVISRFFVLPASNQEEANQMVRFESVKHLPYGAEEYYHNHMVMSYGIDGAKILFVAVEKNLLDKYVEAARALNLKIENIELDILLLARYNSHHVEEPRENVLYLYFFPSGSQLYVVFATKDEVLFWRSIQPFSFDSLKEESFFDRLNSQLKLNYEYLKREYKLEVSELVVVAPSSCTEMIDINFVSSVTVESYSFPLDLSAPDMNGRFPFICMKDQIPAVSEEPYFLNLLPQYYLDSLSKSYRIRQYIHMGIGVTILLGAIAFGLYHVHLSHREARDKYQELVRQYRPLAEEIEEKQNRIKNLQSDIHTENDILTILDKIATIDTINEKIAITRVEYSKGDTVRIEGQALTHPDAIDFREELRDLNIFREVNPRPTQYTTLHGETVLSFEFHCVL